MINIINFLSIAMIGFIGSDRINLLTSNFDSFILTPFLFLSILFIISSVLLRQNKFNFNWIFFDDLSIKVLSFYLITAIISIFFSIDIYLSLKRFMLLLYFIFIFLMLFSFYNKKELINVVLRGSILGIIIIIVFNILLLFIWFYSLDLLSLYINLESDSIAYFAPRLGGYSMDVNRGSVVLLFFVYYIFHFMKSSNLKTLLIFLSIIFIFLSFSRTVYFMLFSIFLYKIFFSNKTKRIILIKYFLSSAIFLTCLLFYLDSIDLININLLVKERLDIFTVTRFTSSGIHLKLIQDGLITAFNNIKILLLGSGIGTSYHLIEGYYWSGSKYGNYHSMYITSLVESGVFNSLSLLAFSFILPLYKSYKNIFLDFIICLFFFNIFYQLNMEPLFWFVILLFYKINYVMLNSE